MAFGSGAGSGARAGCVHTMIPLPHCLAVVCPGVGYAGRRGRPRLGRVGRGPVGLVLLGLFAYSPVALATETDNFNHENQIRNRVSFMPWRKFIRLCG